MFSVPDVCREGGARLRTEGGVRAADRMLDVFGIEITAANDDHVFQAPGHKQLTFAQKPQVPGPQIGLFPRGEARAKGRLGRFRSPEITHRNARSAHPDLPDLAGSARLSRLPIGNHDFLARQVTAATHEGPRARLGWRCFHCQIALQRLAPEAHNGRWRLPRAARGHQRRLCQPVTWEKRFPPEPAHREFFRESLDRVGTNSLRAREGHLPVAEIQIAAIFGANLAAHRS